MWLKIWKMWKNQKNVKKSKKCEKIWKMWKNPKNVKKSKKMWKNQKNVEKSKKCGKKQMFHFLRYYFKLTFQIQNFLLYLRVMYEKKNVKNVKKKTAKKIYGKTPWELEAY